MKCRQAHKLLIGYLEKTLDPHVEKKITEHLSTCDKCFFLYERLGETMSLTGKHQRLPYDQYFYPRLKARMEKELAPGSRRTKTFLQPAFISLIVLLSIALGITLGGGTSLFRPASSADTRLENIRYYANQVGFNEMDSEYIEQSLLFTNDNE